MAGLMPDESRSGLFDTLREIMKRGFSQAEVDRINAALDRWLRPCADQSQKAASSTKPEQSSSQIRSVGAAGVALIKQFEGCEERRSDGMVAAYADPATGGEPYTIGWGATRGGLHGFVRASSVWTQQQCDERLIADLRIYQDEVAQVIGESPTTQNQFDALVAFHYNTGAIARATLTKRHIEGDYRAAGREFRRWNRASGRVLRGLIRRRAAEAKLYARPE